MRLRTWIEAHPARAGTLAGWYQQVCSAVAALVVVPLVIKGLPEADAGLWFAFQGLLFFVNLADFGLSFVITRQVAYSLHARPEHVRGQTDFIETRAGWLGVSDVYGASCRLFQWVALIGVGILILLYHLVVPLGHLLPTVTPATTLAWYLLGASTILGLMAKPHAALLEGLARIYVTRFLGGTTLLLSGFGVILALSLGARLPVMAGVVSALALANYIGLRLLVRWYAGQQLVPVTKLPAGLIRACLRVGAPMGFMGLGSLLVSYVQVPLIGFLIGPQGVPGFYLAQRMGQILNSAIMHLMHPQLPLFTQEVAAGRNAQARWRMKRTVGLVTGAGLLANLAFYLLSPLFVELWVGPGRYVDRTVLLPLCVDYAILTAAVVWGSFVLAAGRNPFVVSTLVSGLMNVALCFGLVPKLGVMGVPLAALLAGLALNYWLNPWFGWNLFRQLRPARQSLPQTPGT